MTKPHLGTGRPSAGFTLIEILVTLTIMTLVAGVLSTVLITSSETHRKTQRRAEIQGASRQALALLTTELRQAGADPAVPPIGVVGIVAADTHSVRVRADLNADGTIQTTEPSEDITFTYDAVNGDLFRDPGAGAALTLDHVTDMRFTYFDAADQPLTSVPLSTNDCALVHSIGVTITAEDRDSQPFTLATRITLRNQ